MMTIIWYQDIIHRSDLNKYNGFLCIIIINYNMNIFINLKKEYAI